MAASYDLLLRQGNSAAWEFRLKSKDSSGALIPFDLTGSSLQFRAERASGGYLTKSIVPADPSSGVFSLSFTVSESRSFAVGRVNRWEIERRISGKEKTLLEGYIIVREGINEDA